MFIRHTATELQRRTAEKNAKIYYAHLPPKKKADLKAKKIRYLLVPTVKSAETSPQAKEVRMTWDTQSESLVDNYVYEFENPPAVGTVAKVGHHPKPTGGPRGTAAVTLVPAFPTGPSFRPADTRDCSHDLFAIVNHP